MDKKIMTASIVMLTVFASVLGAYTITAFATADTSTTSAVADNAITSESSQSNSIPNMNQSVPFQGNMMMERGFGGPMGMGEPRQGQGMMSGMGNFEVSTEYTAKVNAILGNDSDVQNLISQGYNVTAIQPILKTTINGDGTVTTAASNAIVLMQGTSGIATVKVDVTNAAVTQIVTITRTVIDKTTS